MQADSPVARAVQLIVEVVVCSAIGAVAALVLILVSAFVFAGADGDRWVVWFFGNGGIGFLALTGVFAAIAFRYVRRAKLKLTLF